VSLSPLATRFVISLDAQDLLVGVDPESGHIAGLERIARVDHTSAHTLSPDIVLIPTGLTEGDPDLGSLVESGVGVYEFSPHDLEDVVEFFRTIGTRLVGEAQAHIHEIGVTRPLGMIGGESHGQPRPRVLAIINLRPLELAGGHSFETDLIEFSGGQSLTHGGEDNRIALRPDVCRLFSPDLVLLMLPKPPSDAERFVAFESIPCASRYEFFAVDAKRFWLDENQNAARRLRALIEPISRELELRR
jgi:hypothetical protein